MGRDQNIIDQHIYRIIYNMLMELEVYFKANGRNYEALKGRQPDFKDMFERFPKSKPKLMIGPDNWLRAWGSEKIKTITRINGVYVTFEWRSDLRLFCRATDRYQSRRHGRDLFNEETQTCICRNA